ncbi:hypothetical protein BDY19DRAFT_906182 [Irpex rosettiformis]|uniref:Uncharacterized protein n=1 Tax=Irpex rosettiformis TaxID=378272 RepID=A0ACB8U4W6_9APHY|nr:hypothetical protein BDY19DRAFT_906182 [Irpex rosettiformis]
MKVSSLASIAYFVAAASAQYFSEGWQPGDKVTTQTRGIAPEFTPGVQPEGGATTPQTTGKGGFVDAIVQGPLNSLLAKAGINLTASLEAAAAAQDGLWDERIPLIHDDNFNEVIVNEQLTSEEEKERLWFLVISTTSSGSNQQGGISKIIDREFDAAYNETVLANDLPHVKWGRIDYLNVTYLTTKWNVWRAPFLVVLQDRGQSLRFFHATQSRLNSTILRNFLKNEGWRQTEPWNTSFAPGGNNEYLLHYLAVVFRKGYDFINPIPKFLLMIVTGMLGSLIMGLLHRPSKSEEQAKAKVAAQQKKAVTAAAPATPTKKPAESTPSTPSSTKKNGKAKKGGKK